MLFVSIPIITQNCNLFVQFSLDAIYVSAINVLIFAVIAKVDDGVTFVVEVKHLYPSQIAARRLFRLVGTRRNTNALLKLLTSDLNKVVSSKIC